MEKRLDKSFYYKEASDLSKEFHIRDKGVTPKQILILVIVTTFIGIAIMGIDGKLAVTSVVFTLFGCISWYLSLDVKNNRDLVRTSQFQSALFSSALGMHHDFTFIVNLKKRNIFYFDRPFQSVFPQFIKQDDNSLASLLNIAKISEENKKSFEALLDSEREENITFEIDADGSLHKALISIEPIPRPTGFVLVRGRVLS